MLVTFSSPSNKRSFLAARDYHSNSTIYIDLDFGVKPCDSENMILYTLGQKTRLLKNPENLI